MNRSHRKRRTSWIDITFSITLVALTIATIFLAFIYIKNEHVQFPQNIKNVTSTPTVIDTIDSNYPGIKIITETSNDSYAPFAIQYPQSLHSSFNDDVSTYIKNAKQDYLTKMEENKQIGAESPGELNISFETFPHRSGNYSFVFVNGSYLGGTNGVTQIRSFHLNPETGKSITIEDVFDHDQNRLEKLTVLVRESLYNDPTLKNFLFLEDMHFHTEPLWSNFANFAMTDDTIIFYFDEYVIAAGAAGAPIVAVPLGEVSDIIASEFKIKDTSNNEQQNEDTQTGEQNLESDKPEDDETGTTPEESIEDTDVITPPLDPSIKRVALTFDDGPDPKVTRQILETLKKYDAKATFFMLGSRVEYYPDIAIEVKEAGHELGNHTWTHSDLTKADAKKISNEINKTSSIIENVTGQKVTAFRPPYGAVNKTVHKQTNLPVILWDVDTRDWEHRNPIQLLDQVKMKTKDGSIILMHDIHQSTADGLDAVLAYLKNEGYIFVTASELLSW